MTQEAIDGSKPKAIDWEYELSGHINAMKAREQEQCDVINEASHKRDAIMRERMALEQSIYSAKKK